MCFCFAHTADALREDYAANGGVSEIKVSIKVAVADSHGACAHLNPSGNCCLADVHRTLKSFARPTPVLRTPVMRATNHRTETNLEQSR